LRVYVRRKVAKSRLAAGSGIPAKIEIRRGGAQFTFVTDVVELRNDPEAHRVTGAMAAIGSFTGMTDGTLGLAVISQAGDKFALTCRHVVALWDRNPNGDAIESPPDPDGQAGVNTIGNVFSWTRLAPNTLHISDAALVSPGTGITLSNEPLRLQAGAAFGNLTLGEFMAQPRVRVQTFTRRKVVNGTVGSMHNHFTVAFMGNRFHFQDVVEVTYDDEVMGGDSGAAVVQTNTRQVLGLHFAGSGRTGYFVTAQSILQVFSGFGLRPL